MAVLTNPPNGMAEVISVEFPLTVKVPPAAKPQVLVPLRYIPVPALDVNPKEVNAAVPLTAWRVAPAVMSELVLESVVILEALRAQLPTEG